MYIAFVFMSRALLSCERANADARDRIRRREYRVRMFVSSTSFVAGNIEYAYVFQHHIIGLRFRQMPLNNK